MNVLYVTIEEMYKAYYDCRRRKKRTVALLLFETNYESYLRQLWLELNSREYEILPSIAFCVTRPKLREVFAASFSDRVVHWVLYNKIGELLDRELIEDTYNCRAGKGTAYGIRRLSGKMSSISEGYTKKAWILKCDIKGFFMSINKDILYSKLERFINSQPSSVFPSPMKDWINWLIHKIIYHRPELNCKINGNPNLFDQLDPSKSLFKIQGSLGLPIGNLTSQIFANFYMNEFDHYALAIFGEGYGRYVDDFYCISQDKKKLLKSINRFKDYLKRELGLQLHPSKIYILEVKKGVNFIGATVKGFRIYTNKRTIFNFKGLLGNCYSRDSQIVKGNIWKFRRQINCYLGFMKNRRSYKIRKKFILGYIDPRWWKYFYYTRDYTKIVIRPEYRSDRYWKTLNKV